MTMERKENLFFFYIWIQYGCSPQPVRISGLPVNVQLSAVRQIIVDDQWNLLHINSSCPHICGDKHSTETDVQVLFQFLGLFP